MKLTLQITTESQGFRNFNNECLRLIHFSTVYTCLSFQGHKRGGVTGVGLCLQQLLNTPWMGCQFITRQHRETMIPHGNLELSLILRVMFLDCGMMPENPGRTLTCIGRTCKLPGPSCYQAAVLPKKCQKNANQAGLFIDKKNLVLIYQTCTKWDYVNFQTNLGSYVSKPKIMWNGDVRI